ncbi:hypothetical protein V5799_016117 [Amblyomma americanum]|uniref:Uncharacterized protein n=1 Tax=Amblyomma americanum TaxID=6943 RepID=A0AAQ4F6Q4_AMBAM
MFDFFLAHPLSQPAEEATCAVPDRVLADALPMGPERIDWQLGMSKSTISISPDTKRSDSERLGQRGEEEDHGASSSGANICSPFCTSVHFYQTGCEMCPCCFVSRFKGTKLKKIAETIDSETYVVVTGSKAQTAVDTVVQLYPVDTHTASKAYCNLLTCKIIFVDDTLPENFAKAYEEFAKPRSRPYHPPPDNKIIMRMRNYSRVYKEKTAIYLTMERIIKDRWDVFHPETNALWLAYLCGHLSDYLTVPNPTGDWQRKLELLAFMQRDLHRFRSADEFVWNYINKLGHIHTGQGYQPHTWGRRPSASPKSSSGFLGFLRWKDRKKKDPGSGGGPSAGASVGSRSAEQHRGRRQQ